MNKDILLGVQERTESNLDTIMTGLQRRPMKTVVLIPT